MTAKAVVRRSRAARPGSLLAALMGETDGLVLAAGWQWRCRECVQWDAQERLAWHYASTHGQAMTDATRHMLAGHATITVMRSLRPTNPIVEYWYRHAGREDCA